MKKIVFAILTFLAAITCGQGTAYGASGELFVYPVAPDSMTHLQTRCDYIISRFWDRCNFDHALREPEKFNRAFGDWISIMPHASADTVHASIDRLLARFVKKAPVVLELASMAENWLYCDTASMRSDEIYLPFARAAATNKKLSKAERARFEAHVKILESSYLGSNVPAIPVIYPDGSKGTLADINGGSILIFINDPDCMDCSLARVRLSADYNTNELIKRGELTIVSIYPGDTDDDNWAKAVSAAPANWVTVAMPAADEYFDLRTTPVFIFLNSAHKVLANNLDTDYLLGAFRVANQNSSKAQ